MSIQDRIVYDSNELIQILEGSLDRFKPFRFDHKYRELLGVSLLRKIETWEANIRKQKDSPLTLAVCGEFKRGKSSLINAILGEDVVTTDITTETITTNRISYGAHKNEIILSGGRRVKLTDEELKCEKLRAIMESLPEEVTRLELKRPLDILRQVTIIDTPGLQDTTKDFSADVEQVLAQADAVIYVFSVSYPLSVNEQLFIKTIIKPQKYTELFLVGNMADMLDDEESCARVQKMLKDRLENILPGETPILLSALDERCRQKHVSRPNDELEVLLEENFDGFRARFAELLENKRACVLPDRIQRLIGSMVTDMKLDLSAILQGLSMDMGAVSAQMEQLKSHRVGKIQEQTEIEKRIDRLTDLYHAQSVEWIQELIEKMEAEVDSLHEIPTEDIKRFYVLYCVETLQEALQRCMDHSVVKLYEELDSISADISRKMSFQTGAPSVALSFSLQNKTWTRGDNVAFAGQLLGVGGLLGLAVSYVAGSMRQKQVNDKRDDILAEIKAQYTALQESVQRSLSESFKTLNAKAKEQISSYFEEQLQTLETQVEQSAMVARQNDEKKQEIRVAVNELQAVLAQIEEECSFA